MVYVTNVKNTLRTFKEKYTSILSGETNMYNADIFIAYKAEMQDNKYIDITANSTAVSGLYTINEISQLASPASTCSNNIASEQLNLDSALKDLNLNVPLSFSGGMIKFKINDVSFEFSENDTLRDLINTVNKSNTNVSINYSTLSNGLNISTKTTGSDKTLSIVNIEGNAFGLNSAFNISEGSYIGENAKLKINGYTVEKSTNEFSIDGIQYKLKDTLSSGESLSFNLVRDIDFTVNKIKDFVGKYNEMLDSLNKLVNEDKYRDYTPLTEEQKESMNEKDIEKWEEKAKSGLLKNDSALTSLLSSLRSSVYENVEGVGMNLSDIGITTQLYSERGKLVIDEKVLRSALSERPDDVKNLFIATTQMSEEIDSEAKYKSDGFFARMITSINGYYDKIDFTRMDKEISDYDTKIKDLEEKLIDNQERYYKQFTQLETALAKMESQSTWLSQQFSSN